MPAARSETSRSGAFLDFSFPADPHTMQFVPLNAKQDISSRASSMRKFPEIARKTLMEEIVIFHTDR
jgi:hypothetical protein